MAALPAAQGQEVISKADSFNLGMKYLLDDRRTIFETTDAINALYNFKFDKADYEFRFLEAKYPDHPLPTFLLGLLEWWKIVPNEEDKSHDEAFHGRMDMTIAKAEKLLATNKDNLEAAFFLSAGYGFKGRLDADRKNWRKATFEGRNALKYLEMSHGKEAFSPEFLFGDALFNYYREYIAENYVVLRPILAFFPKGSKELGLSQLKLVTQTSYYTRTEAQTYLMRIYSNEEGKPAEGYPMAAYLSKTFPDNPYFERYHARLAFATGRMSECKEVAEDVYLKVKSGYAGYENESMRNAAYFLGYMKFQGRRDTVSLLQALDNFREVIQAAEQVNAMESGYTLSAMYYSGLIEDKLGRRDAALIWMRRLDEEGPDDQTAVKDARTWMATNKIKRKKKFLFF